MSRKNRAGSVKHVVSLDIGSQAFVGSSLILDMIVRCLLGCAVEVAAAVA
jgi:hypothetical protein